MGQDKEEDALGDPEVIAVLRSIKEDAYEAKKDLVGIREARAQDRRVIVRVQVLSALILIVAVVLGFLSVQSESIAKNAKRANQQSQLSVDQLKDCLVSSGKCYQQSQASTGQLLLGISWQSEAQKDVTAIEVAQAQNTPASNAGIPVLQNRLQEAGTVLAEIQQNLADIRDGKPPRNQIPAELPTTTTIVPK